MKKLLLLSLSCSLFFWSCKTSKLVSKPTDDGKLTVTFVQINDVYEIAPLERGRSGGVARVATLKKQELDKNPNTFLVIAGDFVSPSVYNSLKHKGKSIRGQQMIDALNTAGLNIAVFGNHEFDIKENEIQDRINESKFDWIASNSFHKTGNKISPFIKTTEEGDKPIPKVHYLNLEDADGTTAKIGFIGLNIPFNKADYVSYTDPIETGISLYNQIKDSCDAVVAITHLAVEEDSVLAVRLPGLALIMGGHEHDMRFKKIGDVYITKAHANAKSAYVNELTIDKKNKTTRVIPKLVMIDTSLALDSGTNVTVEKWVKIANDNYASLGFTASKVVMADGDPLDGREELIRKGRTNLTRLAIQAMENAAPNADVAIMNSGSIRVDDVLQMPITQYDIIRTLPYGGYIQEADIKGDLLTQILDAGRRNVGNGGFLQYSEAVKFDNGWTINDKAIEPDDVYHVALSDFLLSGGEANMAFLTRENPGIVKLFPRPSEKDDPRGDLRLAIIRFLETL